MAKLKDLQDQATELGLPIEFEGKNLTIAELEKAISEVAPEETPDVLEIITEELVLVQLRKEVHAKKELLKDIEEIKKNWIPVEKFDKLKSDFAESKKVNAELRKEIVALKAEKTEE